MDRVSSGRWLEDVTQGLQCHNDTGQGSLQWLQTSCCGSLRCEGVQRHLKVCEDRNKIIDRCAARQV